MLDNPPDFAASSGAVAFCLTLLSSELFISSSESLSVCPALNLDCFDASSISAACLISLFSFDRSSLTEFIALLTCSKPYWNRSDTFFVSICCISSSVIFLRILFTSLTLYGIPFSIVLSVTCFYTRALIMRFTSFPYPCTLCLFSVLFLKHFAVVLGLKVYTSRFFSHSISSCYRSRFWLDFLFAS